MTNVVTTTDIIATRTRFFEQIYSLLFQILENGSRLTEFDNQLYGNIESIFDTSNPLISLFFISPHHITELLWDKGWFFYCLFLQRTNVISRFPWPLSKLSFKCAYYIQSENFSQLPSIYQTYIKDINYQKQELYVDLPTFYFLMFISYPSNLNNSVLLPSNLKGLYKDLKIQTTLQMKQSRNSSSIGFHYNSNTNRRSQQQSNKRMKNSFLNPFLLKKYPKCVELASTNDSYLIHFSKLFQRRRSKNGNYFSLDWLRYAIDVLNITQYLPSFGWLNSIFCRKSSKNLSKKKKAPTLVDFQIRSMIFDENSSKLMGFYQFLFTNYCHAFIPLTANLCYIPNGNQRMKGLPVPSVSSDHYSFFGIPFVEIISELWFAPDLTSNAIITMPQRCQILPLMKQFVHHLMKKQIMYQRNYMLNYENEVRNYRRQSRYITGTRSGRSVRNLSHIGQNNNGGYREFCVFGDSISVPTHTCICPELYQMIPVLFDFLTMSFNEWPNDFLDYAREAIDIWLILIAPWKCEQICNKLDITRQQRQQQQQQQQQRQQQRQGQSRGQSPYRARIMSEKIDFEQKYAYTNSAHKYNIALKQNENNSNENDFNKLGCGYMIIAFLAILAKFLFNEIINLFWCLLFYSILLIQFIITRAPYLKENVVIFNFGQRLTQHAVSLLSLKSDSKDENYSNDNGNNKNNDNSNNNKKRNKFSKTIASANVGKGSFLLELIGKIFKDKENAIAFSRSYYKSSKLLNEKDIKLKQKQLRQKFKQSLNISFENTQSIDEFSRFVQMFESFENDDNVYSQYKQYVVELLPFYTTLLPLFLKFINVKCNNFNNMELSNQLYYILRTFNSTKLKNLIINCEKCIYQGMASHSPNVEETFIMESVLNVTQTSDIFKVSNYYNNYASPFTSQTVHNNTISHCRRLLYQLGTMRYEWQDYLGREKVLLNRIRKQMKNESKKGVSSPIERSVRQEDDEKAEIFNETKNGANDENENENENENGINLDDPRTRMDLCVSEISSMFSVNMENIDVTNNARLLGSSFWTDASRFIIENNDNKDESETLDESNINNNNSNNNNNQTRIHFNRRINVWNAPQTAWESGYLITLFHFIDWVIFKILFRWLPSLFNNIINIVIFVFNAVGLQEHASVLESKQREKQRMRNFANYQNNNGVSATWGGWYRSHVSWILRKASDKRLLWWIVSLLIAYWIAGSLWWTIISLVSLSVTAYLFGSFLDQQRQHTAW